MRNELRWMGIAMYFAVGAVFWGVCELTPLDVFDMIACTALCMACINMFTKKNED